MHDPNAEPRSTRRVVALDILRFVAAFSVMLYHFAYGQASSGIWAVADGVTRHGYLGVELFFIISGFVVLWSAKGRSVLGFARARVLRLYPEFWLSVLISATVFSLTDWSPDGPLSLREVLVNLTMIPQYLGTRYVDGVYWTLGVEIKFYVLLAVLIVLGQLRHVERWIYIGLAVMTLAAVVDLGSIVSALTIGRYGALFAAGGLFYIVFDQGWTKGRAVGLVVAALLSIRNGIENMPGFIKPEDITSASTYATAAIIAGMFVLFFMIIRAPDDAPYAEVAGTMGALTYPLYLLHNTGKAMFVEAFEFVPLSARILAATAFSLALSYGVYVAGTRFLRPRLGAALTALGLRS